LIFLQEYNFQGSVNLLTMHEIRIAEDLAVIVLEEAEKGNLAEVTKVSICFGELVQIVPDIFEFAFREAVRDTLADGSELDIEIVRVKMKCRVCGNEFQVNINDFKCNICHSNELDFVHGNEMFVKSIEGE
jgi:hydrogenase nickel incorporation protein HypA/HybF